MKRIISLVLTLLIAISSLQVCSASTYYDYDHNYDLDYSRSLSYQQPIYIPVPVNYPSPNCNKTPNVVIHNNPVANASSSGNGIPTKKVIKWGAILVGLACVLKFGGTIFSFISGIPDKCSEWFDNIKKAINPTTTSGSIFSNIGRLANHFIIDNMGTIFTVVSTFIFKYWYPQK